MYILRPTIRLRAHRFFSRLNALGTARMQLARRPLFASVRCTGFAVPISLAIVISVALASQAVFSASILKHATLHSNATLSGDEMTAVLASFHSEEGADSMTSVELFISLNGANPLQEECGNAFTDPGATAVNRAGRGIPVKVSGKVDTGTVGTYTLTYEAVDDKDSVSIDRTVIVVDTTAPEITLEGGNTITIVCGEPFVDPGAAAVDSCQGSLPVAISGSVDVNVQGQYTIGYTASDATNNTKTVTRKVIVGSTEDNPPTIKLTGDAEITLECGSSFIDPGATARTTCSGSVPVVASGIVDVQNTGSYTITYTGSSGSLTAEATRFVTVIDATAPVISLNSHNPMIVARGTTFTDPGATARDGCAGEFAATASGNVDTNAIGSYTITYRASDPSGNQATPVTRTVKVVEKLALAAENFNMLFDLGTAAWRNQDLLFDQFLLPHAETLGRRGLVGRIWPLRSWPAVPDRGGLEQ